MKCSWKLHEKSLNICILGASHPTPAKKKEEKRTFFTF